MFKKLGFLVMTLVFVIGFSFSTVSADSTDLSTELEKEKYKEELSNLTTEEINENFKRIDEEYEIGEEFSLKDQKFIEMYAVKPKNESEITPFAQKKINKSRTVDGITVKINGYIKDDIQNLINQSFGASNLKTSTTKGASKVTSVKTTVHHNAYGLVGSGGIGKVYTGTISKSGKNTTLNATKKYTGIVAYASTWASVTVNYKGGKFTID